MTVGLALLSHEIPMTPTDPICRGIPAQAVEHVRQQLVQFSEVSLTLFPLF